ncbi:MAG: hypothetical protein PHR66_01535 [Desulfuromonadaceae bacterium]|nr:hypothetical protein [Desulfuromonadaceae bacterium]
MKKTKIFVKIVFIIIGCGLILQMATWCIGYLKNAALSQKTEAVSGMNEVNDSKSGVSSSLAHKLIFIHHSVGGHWLSHNDGGLVKALNQNNIYVNDITYDWEPKELTDTETKRIKRKLLKLLKRDDRGAYGIGNRTDIGNMYDWFAGPDSNMIMRAVYAENNETDRFGDHANNGRLAALVAGKENEIVVFKSCYPNTLLKGRPNDKANADAVPPLNYPAGSESHTVANAKRAFNDALAYFKSRPDKFFVIVTPPPRLELPENGRIARGFTSWLYNDWLRENKYPLKNVMVFDLYNVLTSGHGPNESDVGEEQGNHHRLWKGVEQHVVAFDNHVLLYPRKPGDNHPSSAGLKKATEEFVPLLIEKYSHWKLTVSR